MTPIAIAKQLTWNVPKLPPVVRDVDLEVYPGEVLGLIGPNGGGKSTLLMLIAGLITPTGGQIQVDGTTATDLPLQSTGTVGLITAEAGLYPLLTGRENLHYFAGLANLSPGEVDEKSAPLLEELGITDHIDKPSSGYSSGMRQKVSLTRALLLRPKLLLLDEPTSNLDPVSTMTIHHAVRNRSDQGVSIILCTHNLEAAESICDRVAVMQQTIRHVERLDGHRAVPEPGRLYQMYESHVEPG